METLEKIKITVAVTINAPIDKVWTLWTDPDHIIHWNNASDDWHTTRAENDLRVGGRFFSRMEARDRSIGFDFAGKYIRVDPYRNIDYILDDGRLMQITFVSVENETTITEVLEAEQTHSIEMQQEGWQSILNNFKKYVDSSGKELIQFRIVINSSPEKVYQAMLDETKYNEWTAEFNPDSRFEGSWDKGSKMLFTGTDKDGNKSGMISRISENIPNEYVCIEHIGILQNDEEILTGSEIDKWKGVEKYTFTPVTGKTLLTVEMNSFDELKPYFQATWPKALERLKAICERE